MTSALLAATTCTPQRNCSVTAESHRRGKVALIIPCHNEAAALPELERSLARLRAALDDRLDLELLLVDDASTDDTAALMKSLFQEWNEIRILRHESQQGIAGAIATGLRTASAPVVASLDADCTYDPLILVPMLELLTDDIDLVVASPYHPDGRVEGVPAWRLRLSRGASRLYGMVMRNKLHTYTSCVRIYRRDAVIGLSVRDPGFVGIVELLWRLDSCGGRIAEHPATLKTRSAGQSKMRVTRATLAHLGLLSRAALARFISRQSIVGGDTRGQAHSSEFHHLS